MDMPKVQVAQAFALPVLVSLLCGLFLINCGKQPKNRNDCLSEVTQELPERNKLRNRATILVNPANAPCEDRFNCHQFENIDGYYSAVFDGHGGW